MKNTILTAVILMITVLLSGCGVESRVTIGHCVVADPNAYTVYEGEAANTITKTLADNLRTPQGRLNDIIVELKPYMGYLLLTFVGGLIFWGFTRSKYGWVIPTAAIGGIILIITINSVANWVPYGVIGIALAVLIWKAYEYQKERNQNVKER